MAITTTLSMTVTSWNGWAGLNDGTNYITKVYGEDLGFGAMSKPVLRAIERARGYPVILRNAVGDKVLILSVEIQGATTLSKLETLRRYFSTANDPAYLVLTDSNSVARRMECLVESFTPRNAKGTQYLIALRCAGPWLANVETQNSVNVTASGQTFGITNNGNHKTYPTFTITPNSAMAHANSWTRMRRVIIANRSEQPISDPVGDGWPIEITPAIFDTDALNTAGLIRSDLADLRVWLNGSEQYRWLSPATDAVNTKVWVNMQFRSRKTAVKATPSGLSFGTGVGTLHGSGSTPFALWPPSGFLLMESECMYYDSRTLTTLNVTIRGAMNTTAASHSNGVSMYWVEHPFLRLIYDYTNASDPAPPDDRKPVIDLERSSNLFFSWQGRWLNESDRRSAAWQPYLDPSAPNYQYMRIYNGTDRIRFDDGLPDATKPNYNNIYINLPYGTDKQGGTGYGLYCALQGDYQQGNLQSRSMRLMVWGTDFSGNEHLLKTILSLTDPVVVPVSNLFTVRIEAGKSLLAGPDPAPDDSTFEVVTTTMSSISFVNDVDGAILLGAVLRLRKSSSGADRNLDIGVFEDDNGNPGLQINRGPQTISGASLTTSFANYRVAWDTNGSEISLEGGKRYHLTFVQSGGSTGSIRISMTQEHNKARLQYNKDLNLNLSYLPQIWILAGFYPNSGVKSITAPQDALDIPVITGDYLEMGNITNTQGGYNIVDHYDIAMDGNRAPMIQMPAEESCYLLNCRLKNDTTGDYIDLYYPMKVGEQVQVDCENRRVVDAETGLDIPYIAVPSNPAEWISLAPGLNTISYTEVGVVNTDVDYGFRHAWVN